MKLVLLRHGRSEANAQGILAGRLEGVPLDARGREQATVLAPSLMALQPAAVYTSPLQRCRETASAAGFPDARVEPALNECDYGNWSGEKLDVLAKDPMWNEIQSTPSTVRFPGGESMTEMRSRVVGVVESWRAHHDKSATILAVSHGDPIKAILADALGMDFDLFQRLHVAPGSISIVDHSGDAPFVVCINAGSEALGQLSIAGPVVGGGDSHTP